MSESIWNDPRITAYVLDELTVDERTEFEQAMRSNAELAAAVAEASGVTSQLSDLYLGEATPGLDPKRREAIFASESNGTTTTVVRESSWRLPLAIMATAASLLILLGLAPWLAERTSKVAMENAQRTISETGSASDRELVEQKVGVSLSGQIGGAEGMNAVAASSEETSDEAGKQMADVASFGQSVAAESKLEIETRQFAQDRDAMRAEVAKESATTSALSRRSTSVESESMSERAADSSAVEAPVDAKSTRMRHVVAPEYSRVAGDTIVLDKPEAMFQKSNVKSESMVADQIASDPVPAPANPAAPYGAPEMSIAMGREPQKAKYAGRAWGLEGTPDSSGTVRLYSNAPINELPLLRSEIDYGVANPEGVGPGKPGDKFEPITDNAFQRVDEHPLSTFSVDVDTASYSKTRDFVMRANQLPSPDAVRIEELINYFDYDYAGPDTDADHPFAARAVITACPWNEEHRLARIAIKGKEMTASERPKSNLVFLIDTSGSMDAPNKLPLVLQGMEMLLDRLNKKDRVAIVVYAGSAGLVLDSTKVGKNGREIKNALSRLSAGGSTNGGAGIALAYQTARENFIKDGVNRVILFTDGDFNVGTTGTDALVRMVEQEAKDGVFLSVLGFGMGNHNDAMLEQVSGRGNGNYAFIDTQSEARKVLVEQTNATLVTIAKDVKLQIEFNPSKVSAYRLIGYENRILAKEDFNDDKKDAGEIGAGHEVTALYEIVPTGVEVDEIAPKVDPLKYQTKLKRTAAADSNEMLTVKLRYKQPDGDKSTLVDFPVRDDGQSFDNADVDVRFAAAVAGFGMQLRRSQYKGDWMLKDVLSVAEDSLGQDEFGLRAEFVNIVRKASELLGQQ